MLKTCRVDIVDVSVLLRFFYTFNIHWKHNKFVHILWSSQIFIRFMKNVAEFFVYLLVGQTNIKHYINIHYVLLSKK